MDNSESSLKDAVSPIMKGRNVADQNAKGHNDQTDINMKGQNEPSEGKLNTKGQNMENFVNNPPPLEQENNRISDNSEKEDNSDNGDSCEKSGNSVDSLNLQAKLDRLMLADAQKIDCMYLCLS